MAMGDEVLLMINGQAVRIGDEGTERLDSKALRDLFEF